MELMINFHKHFVKSAKKMAENNHKIAEKIEECVEDFGKNGLESSFYRKKLKGDKKNYHELKISGDVRIFIEIKDGDVLFLDIGTHSQLGI